MEYFDADKGTIDMGGAVAIIADLTINNGNAKAYDGKTLVWSGAFTVILAVDLPPGFGFAGRPPGSGNASIASDGTVLLNGATTTITRAQSSNILFAVSVIGKNSFAVTGS